MPIDPIADTKEDWRELGFYYELAKGDKIWRLVGSRQGLSNLSKTLTKYASDDHNRKVSEHEHLPPYSYLTIITAEVLQITDYGIFGSIPDLLRLADIVSKKLDISKPGDVLVIDTEYSGSNEAVLTLEIKEDGFDPSDADDFAWAQK